MKNKNIGFYERYKKELKQKQAEDEFRKKYNISDDKTVIFEKKSKVEKIAYYVKNVIVTIFKIFVYFLICILSTIGATVLLNEALRVMFFEVLATII